MISPLLRTLAALTLVSCAPTVTSDAPDILVVVLDTTSPLAVAEAMPNAQAFVDAGRSWDVAVSPSNTTIDGTGGIVENRFVRVSDLAPGDDSTAETTLAELVSEAGYSTLFSSGNEALDHELFARGFDRVHVQPRAGAGEGADAEAVEQFVEFWDELPAPRFGWLQLITGHDYQGHSGVTDWPPVGPDELEEAWGWYTGDAASTDALLPEIFALVPADAGLVVLTADHGEHFSDRGPLMLGKDETFGHGNGNAPLEILVPLALRGPGAEAGRQVDPVSTLDLHPTVLAAAGLDSSVDLRSEPGLRAPGASLCNLLNLQLSEGGGNMSVLVQADGGQIVRTHAPELLPPEERPPLLVAWDATGVGVQTDWQELAIADLSTEQTAFLFDEALPECRGFADLCEEYPELGAIGYIDCDD